MQLFLPHIGINGPLQTAVPWLVTPAAIILHSKICLETLMRLYYIRHSYEHYHDFLMYFLIFVGNMAIEALDPIEEGGVSGQSTSETYRSTLILCVKGLQSQGKSFYLANLTSRALQDRVKQGDLQLLRTHCNSEADIPSQTLVAQHSQSQWPIPIIKINEDPDLATLDNLLSEYDQLPMGHDASASREADTTELR